IWGRIVLMALGIFLNIRNIKTLDENQVYVFISNHRSHADIPVCVSITGHYFKFLAKEELTRVPLLGWIISKLYLTVSRKNTRDRVKSMINMKEALNNGTSLWLYPEGTRARSEDIIPGDFEDGAFWLAIETQKPLAVISIRDTGAILSTTKIFYLLPGIVHCTLAGIIDPTGMKKTDIPALKENARHLLQKGLQLN
nr:1-acyl-sn-glycerol-3-phosphate acyltransferase [Bacteroidota bacterium]